MSGEGTSSPIIEDLASQDMTPNAPTIGMPSLPQPVVAQDLRVVVVRLER